MKRRSLFRVFLYDHWDRALTVMEGHLAFKCNCSKGESPTSTDKAGGGNPSVNWFEQKLKMATRFTIKVIDFRFKIKRSLSTIWSCLMGKTEDYRQPTTRHFHKKEAHCKVQNHVARELEWVVHVRGDWYPARETNGIMGQTKMAGVLTINLTRVSKR